MQKIEMFTSMGFTILVLAIVAILSQIASIALFDQITMLFAGEAVALVSFALCAFSMTGNPQSVE